MLFLCARSHKRAAILPALFAALAPCLVACSPEPAIAPEAGQSESSGSAPITPASAAPSATALARRNVLTLEGLGTLKIGEAVPPASNWAARGAQIPGSCTMVSSPDFIGVYAIVEAGKVHRITVGSQSDVKLREGIGLTANSDAMDLPCLDDGSQSDVKLREGIGIGTPEKEVHAAFPDFREEPHKYVESPAKYLTAPEAAPGRPALRFEIDGDGKVSLIHVGLMPVLAYVEGCA